MDPLDKQRSGGGSQLDDLETECLGGRRKGITLGDIAECLYPVKGNEHRNSPAVHIGKLIHERERRWVTSMSF